MPLTENINIDRYIDQQLRTLKVEQDVQIFRGALVGLNRSSGHVRPLQAGDMFVGIAYSQADNRQGEPGNPEVTVFTEGDFEMTLPDATRKNIGDAVTATDDATLKFCTGACRCSYVGHIVDSPAENTIILRIDPFRPWR